MKEHYQSIANKSSSRKEFISNLGFKSFGTYRYKHLNQIIKEFDIDISHFSPWNKRGNDYREKITLDDILAGKYPKYSTWRLKLRLIGAGLLEHKCSKCSLTEWNGQPIPIDLDHINGNPSDHRLVNIRLLCRNCHAQTGNFCGKNIDRSLVRNKISATREEFDKQKIERNTILKTSRYKELILNSTIDFTKYGWIQEVSNLTGVKPQKVSALVKRIMPEFYENCFHRK